jgi:hypothetical protein
MWPLIQANIPNDEHRIEFTGSLLTLMVENDMDTYDIEDIHPDVRAAMRTVGIDISEPDRYTNEATDSKPTKKWWQLR